MKRIVQAAFVLLLTPLAACEYHKLQQLNYAEPVGEPYQKALWANYRSLTREEERNYNWSRAVFYADKALRSAYGEDVLPDDPRLHELPDSLVKHFEKAREDLLIILSGDAKLVRPQLVADAQTSFDCWLQNQAKNTRQDNIEFCRDAFYATMQELITPVTKPEETKKTEPAAKPKAKAKPKSKPKPKSAAQSLTPKPAPAPVPAPAKEEPKHEAPAVEPVLAPEPTPVKEEPKQETPAAEMEKAKPVVTPFDPPKEEPKLTTPPAEPAASIKPQSSLSVPAKEAETASYIVFFDAGQSALNPTAEKIVDGAAQSLLKHKSYRIVVNARNDLFGNVESGLPGQRAQMVKSRLILQGIPESAIDILLAGESSPAAGPQSSAPVSRRVEIFISE